jgi:ABC-2 type transport system ATP-binding protein
VARAFVTPSLPSIVEFQDAGVTLPKVRRRPRGSHGNRLRRFAGEVSRDEVWYLREATLAVAPGEALAIVGHRGSGREELLRLAAGTLMPDEGTVRRRVPVVPVMNLGGALSGGYTVRQNIYLLGGLLGMLPDQIQERLPEITERASVAKILDKFLGDSSRMVRGRLAWAIAMATDAQAFAIAGALVVGQPDFQKECWTLVEERRDRGVTFMVASDKPSELRRFCSRAILLDAGRIVLDTTVDEALEELRKIPPPKDQVHFVLDVDDDDDDEDLV